MSERGRDFFLMTLARELKMTRRQLLQSMDSYELSMWDAYLKEINKPPEQTKPPEQNSEALACQLKNVLATHGAKDKSKKKGKK